ncbi:DUF881 domain-containing protein [Alkaliphilus transvaalensis]|uniref:DUF881 domain-containing protein n=1 Tax=Alkaliphilus transvaalensis TaxID=114628 RepID=UPI000479479C|nr:DUF881 domain-containing protein [Alkaliphilus transvaalensis]
MKKAYSKSKVVITLIFILFGYVFTTQFLNTTEDYSFVSLKTISDLQDEINKERTEVNDIREIIRITNNRLAEYERAVQEGGSIKEVLYDEINELRVISGFVDLEGEGVIVSMSDATRDLYELEDPNNLLIHEGDVLAIVNDLKFAGAEAISINGQRLLPNSEIKCAGYTITINGHTYGQPFVIRAIGDPVTLEASVKSPDSNAHFLRQVYGVVIEAQTSSRIRIPRYDGDIVMNHINLKEGE